MKQVRRTLPRLLRLLAVSALAYSGWVHASDYTEISQLLRDGKPAQALTKADQRLSANPRDPQLRFLRGVAQADSGKQGDAITTFTKLTEEYPELPEPYNNLAVLYAHQNQLDKARGALEMAIRTNPSYATAHENLGDIYAKLASQAYNKALTLDASNANSVKPKLALIRELFSLTVQTKAATPLAAPATVAPPSVVTAPRPAPVVTAPTVPVAPTPAPAPVQAPVAPPTPPAPAAPPVVAPVPAPAPVAAPAPAPAAAPVRAPASAPAPVTADDAMVKAVTSAVRAWAAAWAAKDMKGYLAAYDPTFSPAGRQTKAAWEKEREARITEKRKISVDVLNLQVSVKGSKATARFRQAYSADALKVSSRKTLDLIQSGDRWTIVRESTGG